MTQFLLITTTEDLDMLINIANIIALEPSPTDEDRTILSMNDGEHIIRGNFWTFYSALQSAQPLIDCQPGVGEVEPTNENEEPE